MVSKFTKKLQRELSDTKRILVKVEKRKLDRPKLISRKVELQKKVETSKKVDKGLDKAKKYGDKILGFGFKKEKGKILKKPKVKVPSVDPKKFITQGLQKPNLVREGRTGYIQEEMIKEMKWLS